MMANGFNGIFLVATNPCDIITWQVWQLSGLPRSQVLGTGVWLDTTRLRRLLAQELEIGAQSIDAFILGEHGDTQFPVWSHSSVYGTPIADLYQQRTGLPLDREAMADKVRKLGFEIYAGKGCTEYGVAGTIAEICRNIFTGSHRALAVSCILDGEYGVSGAAAGCRRCWPRGGVKRSLTAAAGEERRVQPVDRGDQGQYRPSALTAACESVGNDQLRGKGLQRLAGFIRQVGVGDDIGQRRGSRGNRYADASSARQRKFPAAASAAWATDYSAGSGLSGELVAERGRIGDDRTGAGDVWRRIAGLMLCRPGERK